jgi:hypothetical protein
MEKRWKDDDKSCEVIPFPRQGMAFPLPMNSFWRRGNSMRAAWKGLRGCLRISPSPLEGLVNEYGKGLLVLPFGYEVWLSRDCDY